MPLIKIILSHTLIDEQFFDPSRLKKKRKTFIILQPVFLFFISILFLTFPFHKRFQSTRTQNWQLEYLAPSRNKFQKQLIKSRMSRSVSAKTQTQKWRIGGGKSKIDRRKTRIVEKNASQNGGERWTKRKLRRTAQVKARKRRAKIYFGSKHF